MGRIKQLPTLLINQIAAGECIERPASVVKELVENALDAGATSIKVHVEEAGKKCIRVTDNGIGIAAEDLVLAFTSHATSKISSSTDLQAIATLGFRGEALASIGAVSQASIKSRPADQQAGAVITNHGGRLSKVEPVGMPKGTEIEVRNLFYNIPARRKFLRTTATEMGHIQEILTRLALSAPKVAFHLTHGKRTTWQLPPGQDLRRRLAALWGTQYQGDLLPIKAHELGLQLHGYLLPPEHHRPNNKMQAFFINNRYVRDPVMMKAVSEAAREYLPTGRHLVILLALTMDPAQVDVNVHPSKIEVRYRESGTVFSVVRRVVWDTLQQADLAVSVPLTAPANLANSARPADQRPAGDKMSAAGLFANVISNAGSPSTTKAPSAQQLHDPGAGYQATERGSSTSSTKPPATQQLHDPGAGYQATAGGTRPAMRAPQRSVQPENIAHQPVPGATSRAQTPAPVKEPAVCRLPKDCSTKSTTQKPTAISQPESPLGNSKHSGDNRPTAYLQVHDSYIVYESADGITIIDQHALHERLLYNQLKAQLAQRPLASQMLLFPQTVTLTPTEKALLLEKRALFSRLGIEVEEFGPNSVIVRSLPQLLSDLDVAQLLPAMLERICATDAAAGLESLLATMACRGAVKAGEKLQPAEIMTLLDKRDQDSVNAHCPHGRPTHLKITWSELAKHFQRR